MILGILFWLLILMVLYAYAGYPLLLALFAPLAPRPPAFDDESVPSVTLLIAAYNEQDVIARKLDNCLELDYPPDRLQILVAADGSDDRTADVVRGYADRGVELSYSPERAGKMAAINRAVPLARGDILLFSDANNMYAPDVVRKLVAPFSDSRTGATTGAKAMLTDEDALGQSEGLYWRYESFIKRQESRLGTCTTAAGEILAVRRDLYVSPPDKIINDDFFIAMLIAREGNRIVYVPDAFSYERASQTARDEIARRARIVAGRYQAMVFSPRFLTLRRPIFVWQVISHKFLRPLVPIAMIAALLVNVLAIIWPPSPSRWPLLSLATPYNWILLGLQLLFYALAWIGARYQGGGLVRRVLYLPTFLVNSNAAALKGAFLFLTGRQTVLWERVGRHEE